MTATAPRLPRAADPDHRADTPAALREGQAPAIAAKNLALTFPNGVAALRDATLLVAPREHLAIVGPSGSGKTTLLRCLAGELQPDAGAIALAGRAACVYQDYRLVARSSALQNVLHGAAGRAPQDGGRWKTRLLQRKKLKQQAQQLLQTVGLQHRASVRADKLSGGEKQRVAIARALMANPAVVLADEPVSALDAGSAEAIMALLRAACRERNITLVSVLHDCKLAETYADRIVSVRDGQLHAGTLGLLAQPNPNANACDKHDQPATIQSQPAQLRVNGQPQPQTQIQAIRDAPPPHAFDPNDPRCAICPDNMPAVVAEAAPPTLSKRFSTQAKLIVGLALLFAALGWSAWMSDLSSVRLDALGKNLSRFAQRLIPTPEQLASLDLNHLAASFLQTLAMTILGTVAAVLWSLPLAALAARNAAPPIIRVPVRLLLNIIRSVPSLLWALVAVGALGLGPLPGIVALAAYSTGYLTKFFYEAFESVDDATPAALRALGMAGPEAFLAAVWPAARLALISASIFMLEYNFRAASVLGVVGAGGIGYDLKLAVEWSNWHVVGVILAVLAAAVILFDALADAARRALK